MLSRRFLLIAFALSSFSIAALPTVAPAAQDLTATLVPTVTATVSAPTMQATQQSVPVDLAKLAKDIDNYLRIQKFIPGSTRQGSVYVQDLRSGQSITVNADVIYSGVSMMKIGVLVAFYRKFTTVTAAQANLIAKMMICSDNDASNALITLIGDGSSAKGLIAVTDIFHKLSLAHLVLGRPFLNVNPEGNNVSSNPQDADADTYNRATPDDLGSLIAAIYKCALADQSGGLAVFSDTLSPDKCRMIVHVMRADHLGALIEAGVPDSVPVAHKQGWDGETHGDAALIMTAGGDYVLTIILHQRTWLNHLTSFPAMSEVSRMVYNAYNPAHKLNTIHAQPIPLACPITDSLLSDLQIGNAPLLK